MDTSTSSKTMNVSNEGASSNEQSVKESLSTSVLIHDQERKSELMSSTSLKDNNIEIKTIIKSGINMSYNSDDMTKSCSKNEEGIEPFNDKEEILMNPTPLKNSDSFCAEINTEEQEIGKSQILDI